MTDDVRAEPVIYTLGHSSHPLEHFVALLARYGISRLVDVRSHPHSRWAPQFAKSALRGELLARHIEYVFLGRELGGRPEGTEYRTERGALDYARRALAPEFRNGIERLVGLAREQRCAMLCAEEDPSSCHRRWLLAPALRSRGMSILHIRGDGSLEADAPRAQLRLFE